MRKFMVLCLLVVVLMVALAGCAREADVASYNVSQAADSFEVNRRIVFYNGITGDYMLVIEGLCSLGNNDQPGELSVTCKTGANEYKKHYLGLSDNVTYFAEQIAPVKADPFHYRIIFRPTEILPDVDVQTP